MEEERKFKAEEVRVRRERETEEMEKGVALAWIMYMRFARRAEVSFISFFLPIPSCSFRLEFATFAC